ncbi:Unknown protein [Striga hermonthica]|uniref:CCHC-type domain-containing protein n=1 Tax=Striga hermonthica TaxID=68872 RepID=A0A9N7MMG9_STRHE|nr:Unknown protein [Striga hermonthica]
MASSSNIRKEQSVEVELEQKLEKLSLSEAENSIVDIAQDDIKVRKSECQKSLFGKIIGDRSASLFGVKRTIGQIWKIQGAVEVRELSNNFFQFIFNNVEDLQKVASGQEIQVEKGLFVFSAINVKEPLLRCANVRLGYEIIKVSFKYEKLVNLCYYCGTLGHLDKDCKKRIRDIARNALQDGQYGEWLKVSEGQHIFTSPHNSHSASMGSKSTGPNIRSISSATKPSNTSQSQGNQRSLLPIVPSELIEDTILSHSDVMAETITPGSDSAIQVWSKLSPTIPSDTSQKGKGKEIVVSNPSVPIIREENSMATMAVDNVKAEVAATNPKIIAKTWKRATDPRGRLHSSQPIKEPPLPSQALKRDRSDMLDLKQMEDISSDACLRILVCVREYALARESRALMPCQRNLLTKIDLLLASLT